LNHGSRASIHRSGGMAGEHLHVHGRLYDIANNFFEKNSIRKST